VFLPLGRFRGKELNIESVEMKDLGDRMKRYESVSQYKLTPRMPVIIRLDGRAFHTLTRKMGKPFDEVFMRSMVDAAQSTCQEIQGFKLAYVQSDEVNILLTDYDNHETEGWFRYKLSKMISISAALMSVHFTQLIERNYMECCEVFDSRAFNIPIEDVANYFLWRVKDWNRNSLNMYAQSFFSHKQLINKHSSEVHEMLHSIGKNWATDLSDVCKNGTWIPKRGNAGSWNLSSYQEIENFVKEVINEPVDNVEN